ncbi:MAG TPA: hypothetical protein VF744_01120 [Beijerinckiaceae bacterium]|jgi:hypothetical protein
MADLPDLQGEVLGMRKAEPDQPGFDPDQPWYVRFRVRNKGTAGAGAFSVRLETFNGPELSSGVFCWTSQRFNIPFGPGAFLESDFHLPTAISQADFGVKNVFVFTIDWKNEIDESGDPANNFIVWAGGTGPPILPGPPPSPTSPPSPWKMSAAAAVGHKDVVIVNVKNDSARSTPEATLELYLNAPTPGAPVGKPQLAASAKIPSLALGAKASITLAARREFISPEAASVRPSPLPTKGAQQTSRFKPLIPFSIKVKEADGELGFGPPPPKGGGPIKIPGKK